MDAGSSAGAAVGGADAPVVAVVASVNVGAASTSTAKRVGSTGFDKRPVTSVEVRAPGPKRGGLGSGLVGDFVGDRRHHGGDAQAVYAFAAEELDVWSVELGRELPAGSFGENLTTAGLDVDAAIVGERWHVGTDVVLRVTGPRLPCATFHRRLGVRGWTKRFTARGRTGAYLAVERPGTLRPGDAIVVSDRPAHAIDVPTTFRAFVGDAEAAVAVLTAGCFDDDPEALADLRRVAGAAT